MLTVRIVTFPDRAFKVRRRLAFSERLPGGRWCAGQDWLSTPVPTDFAALKLADEVSRGMAVRMCIGSALRSLASEVDVGSLPLPVMLDGVRFAVEHLEHEPERWPPEGDRQ